MLAVGMELCCEITRNADGSSAIVWFACVLVSVFELPSTNSSLFISGNLFGVVFVLSKQLYLLLSYCRETDFVRSWRRATRRATCVSAIEHEKTSYIPRGHRSNHLLDYLPPTRGPTAESSRRGEITGSPFKSRGDECYAFVFISFGYGDESHGFYAVCHIFYCVLSAAFLVAFFWGIRLKSAPYLFL